MVLGVAVQEHRRDPVELGLRGHAAGQDGAVDQTDQRLAQQLGEERGLEVGVAVADAGGDGQPVLPGALAHGVELQRAPGVGGYFVGDVGDHRRAGPGRRCAVARRHVAEVARGLAHRCRVAADSRAPAALLSTSETAVCDTPARAATSIIVGPRRRTSAPPAVCASSLPPRFIPVAAVS